ncbi:YetF domain-containing protein [Sphingomonas sp. ST-64]|uniref:YetF domain-containing protein n=1 Tax=Sphingomonas plantiphila TaxID=3163295 RepID=A0ABW8YR48_9SPHN
MFYDNALGLLRVFVITLSAYVILIVVLRAAGKRALAKLNAFDLVVTVALGSTLATVLLSKDVALAEGAMAFAMLAALQYAVAWASIRSDKVRDAVRAEPRMLLEDGVLQRDAMTAERVTADEVASALRRKGIGRLADAAAVVLETDGSLSVIAADAGKAAELDMLEDVQR